MVLNRQGPDPLQTLGQLFASADVALLQEAVAQTHISTDVVKYIIELINATRQHEDISRGASPRATLAVTAMAKAVAQLRARDYVIPKDVQEVFSHVVAHRLLLSERAEAKGLSAEQVLKQIIDGVSAPKLR